MNLRQMLFFILCLFVASSCGMGLKIAKLTPGNSTGPEEDSGTFITQWDTTKTGNVVSDNFSIRLPLVNGCTYNFTVDWGDGSPVQTITTWNDPNSTHTYSSSGIKAVEMLGTIGCLSFDSDRDGVVDGDASKLIDVVQWGANQWSTMEAMFQDADQLTSFSATDVPDLSQVTSMSFAFRRCSLFNGNLNNWDTSNVIHMNGIFQYAPLFNQDIGNWNTSQVLDMRSMFQGASNFNQNIAGWDTFNVNFMSHMFTNAAAFNQNISSWQTSNVHLMDHMFELATSFSQDLSLWNVSSVIDHSAFNLGNFLLIPPNF